jgi:hypothetical protein
MATSDIWIVPFFNSVHTWAFGLLSFCFPPGQLAQLWNRWVGTCTSIRSRKGHSFHPLTLRSDKSVCLLSRFYKSCLDAGLSERHGPSRTNALFPILFPSSSDEPSPRSVVLKSRMAQSRSPWIPNGRPICHPVGPSGYICAPNSCLHSTSQLVPERSPRTYIPVVSFR